jgi:TatA/E family protein of Tat protein translocase
MSLPGSCKAFNRASASPSDAAPLSGAWGSSAQLLIILLIVLVLFGAKKLPDRARSLGQSLNEFSKARQNFDREVHNTGAQSAEPTSIKK